QKLLGIRQPEPTGWLECLGDARYLVGRTDPEHRTEKNDHEITQALLRNDVRFGSVASKTFAGSQQRMSAFPSKADMGWREGKCPLCARSRHHVIYSTT